MASGSRSRIGCTSAFRGEIRASWCSSMGAPGMTILNGRKSRRSTSTSLPLNGSRMSERINVRTEIEERIDRDPFDPFVIVMSSGHRYRIEDPGEVVVGDEAIVILPFRRGGHSVLTSTQISSVDVPG